MDRKESFELEEIFAVYTICNSLSVVILDFDGEMVEWRFESGAEREEIHKSFINYEDNTDRGGDLDAYFRYKDRMFYLYEFTRIDF